MVCNLRARRTTRGGRRGTRRGQLCAPSGAAGGPARGLDEARTKRERDAHFVSLVENCFTEEKKRERRRRAQLGGRERAVGASLDESTATAQTVS